MACPHDVRPSALRDPQVLRQLALAPLSRTVAESLFATIRQTHAATRTELLLHARCLSKLESFDAAWAALQQFRSIEVDSELRSRAAIDLLYLCYFLARPDEREALVGDIEPGFAHLPLLTAEFRLALSLVDTGRDQLPNAYREVRLAEHAIRLAEPSHCQAVVAAAIFRQLAHLHAQSGDHTAAAAALTRSRHAGIATREKWEALWAEYLDGFVAWHAGELERAREQFAIAMRELKPSLSSLWRWTTFCLGVVEAELGELERADRMIQQSGHASPASRAFIALRAGEPALAVTILATSGEPRPTEELALKGLAHCAVGSRRLGLRALEEARIRFSAGGLFHYARSCALHSSYWRALAGARRTAQRDALRIWKETERAGGEGFAWFDCEVAYWIVETTSRSGHASDALQRLRARAAQVRRRRRSLRAEDRTVIAAAERLRARGLTDREIDILAAIERSEGLARSELARLLGMSPNTLKVHLTQLRSKLAVVEVRGDPALLAAALDSPPEMFDSPPEMNDV